MSSDMSADMIKRLRADDERLRQTETKEVPGGIPGFTSFYAIGTWTPAFVGTTIAGTFTYGASRFGTWTRIGNTVFLRGRVTLTAVAVAATGNLTITGLPLAAAQSGAFTAAYWGSVVLTAGKTDRSGWIQAGTSVINLTESGNNIGAAFMPAGNINAATDIPFIAEYQV